MCDQMRAQVFNKTIREFKFVITLTEYDSRNSG